MQRDCTRTESARAATLSRRMARQGKRACKFLAFETPRALQLNGGAI